MRTRTGGGPAWGTSRAWQVAALVGLLAGCGARSTVVDPDAGAACADLDGDGFPDEACGGDDCNDLDPAVHPGAPDNEPTGEWTIETVDAEGDTGSSPSLAVDGAGAAHVAYCDRTNDRLQYATNATGEWTIETIDAEGGVTFVPSLALDGTGAVHVGYEVDYPSTTADRLRYATNGTGEWVIEMVTGDGETASEPSLALDAAGAVHIGFGDNSDSLLYATNATGEWTIETVDRGGYVESGPSLALDAEGTVHLAGMHNIVGSRYRDLQYATNATGEWLIEMVDEEGDCAFRPSLALDAAGAVHIGYHECTGAEDLHYVTNATGEWVIETVDTEAWTGLSPSLALDAAGAAHIAYCETIDGSTGHRLRYATNARGAWAIETVDAEGETGLLPSLALDSAGAAHIAYLDRTDHGLEYATNGAVGDGVDQNCDGVDGLDADGDGHASIATDGDDCDDGDPDVFEGCE